MPTMKDVGDSPSPAHKPKGQKTPLTHITRKKSAKDDHYNVTGPKSADAYYTSGFGYNGENVNEPGDGVEPHVHKHGLTTDERLPKPTVRENLSQFTHPGKVMNPGGAKKVTPNSKYPYDRMADTPVEGIHESPEDQHDGMRVLVWTLGSQSDAFDTTWGEFLQANPDIAEDIAEKQKILNTLLAGKTYQERGADGMFGIVRAEGNTMKKTNEDAMAGGVSAGNMGTGSPNALFTTDRVKEEEGDPADEEDKDLEECKGKIVEFERNGVPYRGRLMEVDGKYAVINTAGRMLTVEADLVRYGIRTAKQTHGMSSPTTPNRTMQKFIGASEAVGDGQGELPGMQTPQNQGPEVDEVTGPAHWASALVNGDESGLDQREIDQLEQWTANLAKDGWYVVDTARDEETGEGRESRFTNHWQVHNPYDDPQIRGGDVIDYVVHRDRNWNAGPTKGEQPVSRETTYPMEAIALVDLERAATRGRGGISANRLMEAPGGEPVWGIKDYKRLGIIDQSLYFGEDSLFDFRRVAYEFHGGQDSALYSFASTDLDIYGPPHAESLISEIEAAMKIAENPKHHVKFPKDDPEGPDDLEVLHAMLKFVQVVLKKMKLAEYGIEHSNGLDYPE